MKLDEHLPNSFERPFEDLLHQAQSIDYFLPSTRDYIAKSVYLDWIIAGHSITEFYRIAGASKSNWLRDWFGYMVKLDIDKQTWGSLRICNILGIVSECWKQKLLVYFKIKCHMARAIVEQELEKENSYDL